MTDGDIKYMIEALIADLAELLSIDFGMTVSESLDTLYNSETYSRLINPAAGLYFQSAQYVYSFLKNELTTGKIA
ncbi:hypothetical protein [Muribaculum intestinale]|uniref:hypothetical protein n=1 Tax=Muribaculum intestinale TaxID=1796646 RepID=UPI000F4AA8B0|nr:hypothetical protein [Muribaculum intestinale]ROT11264.1 hypothetical protein EEL42_00680 [Muribaculaceae bacterium Isolate-100 (HZI)]RXE67273.1 hypothetical protein ED388_00675 [Muribaculaceae bacterium Isolate-007 (NCI)]TGX87655.1 hypothetical protein E5360_00070 [Muribaculum intestinale]